MKKGFYYYKLLDWYTIVYIYDEQEDKYLTKEVATIRLDGGSIDIDVGEESYVSKDASSLYHYIFLSDSDFDKYREILIWFIFEVMK